jgi:Raf kinase inhibitor-like YbhB/YbcL family protein
MGFWASVVILLAALAVIATGAGCISPSQVSPVTTKPAGPAAAMTGSPAAESGTFALRIDSLAYGAILPDLYTCTGSSESPEVSWSGIPEGTQSLVLILDDPDAPSGVFTHWIVYNVPLTTDSFRRDQPNEKVLSDGSQQGVNTAGTRGYYPPCPPVGSTHRYVFHVYAVDTMITMPTADRKSIDYELTGHILGNVEFETKFGR